MGNLRNTRSRGWGLILLALVALLAVLIALLATGCGDDDSTTTTVAGDTETTAGGEATTTSAASTVTRGGTLRVAMVSPMTQDPAFINGPSDNVLLQQIYDPLILPDADGTMLPRLAREWENSTDNKTWTFHLQEGVTFHNGDPMTAADVVYTFDRLRDPDVGAATVAPYANIAAVTAVDDTTVQFTLSQPNPEFLADAADWHALILNKNVADPATEAVGTGPFKLESFSVEDRAVLVKNEQYWGTDDNGEALPYLDGIDMSFSPDQAGHVSALQSGDAEYVPGLSAENVQIVQGSADLEVVLNPGALHYVIHMRSDEGHVAADNRVRQALRLATNNQDIADLARPGLAEIGNGTPVGPVFGDYYLDQAPPYDVEKAKALLKEAGQESLSLTLYTSPTGDEPAIATVWKEQMAEIGVEVDIQQVTPDIYYSPDADNNWMEADFGLTIWGARSVPIQLFQLAYVTDGPYNESHWSDPEFDELVAQIATEGDRNTRIDLYMQAQEILLERGPVIVPFMATSAVAQSNKIEGVLVPLNYAQAEFAAARFK